MAKTVLVLIVLVMFSIGLFIVSKVGVFLKESKKKLLMKEKEYN